MKHYITLLLISLSFVLGGSPATAQESQFRTPSNFNIVIKSGDVLFIVNQKGELIDTQPAYEDEFGDIEYYDRWDNQTKVGKLKRLGDLTFDYYDNFDRDELRGKLKSVNSTKILYHDVFDRDELRGKVKAIGTTKFTYYDAFDNQELVGKFKSAGALRIEYFDNFDGEKSGRIKSIKGNSKDAFVSRSY